MKIENNILKHYLKNVYFITGTGYAGKSTTVRMIAERYGLTGYNLALPENYEGAYNIGVFPTYILIGPDGNIIEYKTSRPSELLADKENVLDKALKKSNTKR